MISNDHLWKSEYCCLFILYIKWGITFENNFVVDLTANPTSMTIVAKYGTHAITDSLGNMVSLFPTARSITVNLNKGNNLTELAFTSSQPWAEYNLGSLHTNNVTYDAGTDKQGPVVVGAAAENTQTGSRIVAFGDSQFPTNAYYQYYANADMFLNAVDWVAHQDNIISLTARSATTRLLVAPSGYGLNAILLGVVVLIPLAIIVAAVTVFIQRHREV
jgi:ABC-type uncharacterized transport system involved in gliding motility auxiliary subunit